MPYTIVILDEAEKEFEVAAEWYETQKAGLGNQLRNDFEETLVRILANPLAYRAKRRQVRSARLNQFDRYAVYYQVIGQKIFVLSLFHASRSPGSLKKNLPSE